jgi:NADH-quinone oxidoreductase subunit G
VVPRPFTIHAEKCPNRRGVTTILEHFEGKVIGFDELKGRVAAGEFQGLYVASDAMEAWIDEATTSALRSRVGFLVVQDTTVTPLAHSADVVLAGATFAEKAGSYVNADGRLQYSEAALPPRDGSLPDLDLLAILLDRPGGPVVSSEVLAELAEALPAFGVAKGGKLPGYGIPIGQSEASGKSAPPAPPSFTDAWFVAHGAARWR